MIGRLLRKCDFERALAVPPCSRSAHFAVHHLYACPSSAAKPPRKLPADKLCTSHAPAEEVSVDNLPSGHWVGSLVPKRHAPRAVTRNMLKRQMRAAMQRHQPELRPGLWLLRLRQPFVRGAEHFVSADSARLRAAAASELDRLLERAGR